MAELKTKMIKPHTGILKVLRILFLTFSKQKIANDLLMFTTLQITHFPMEFSIIKDENEATISFLTLCYYFDYYVYTLIK